jgi:hypothetical protein
VFAWPDLEPQWGILDFAADALDKCKECQKYERRLLGGARYSLSRWVKDNAAHQPPRHHCRHRRRRPAGSGAGPRSWPGCAGAGQPGTV